MADLFPAAKTGGGGVAPVGTAAAAPSTHVAAAAATLQPADLGATLAAAEGSALGEALQQLSAFDAPPAGLAGKQRLVLVGCSDGVLAFFRQPTGGSWRQEVAHRPSPALGPSAAVSQARLSPDCGAVAWADEGRRVWVRPLAAGAEPACLLLPAQPTVLAWQPGADAAPGVDLASSGGSSGELLAVALADNTVRLLAWWAGELVGLGRLRGHSGAVRSMAWLARDQLLSGAEDQSVRRWRVGGELPKMVEAAREAAAHAAAQAGQAAETATAGSDGEPSEVGMANSAAAATVGADKQAGDAIAKIMLGLGAHAACSEGQPSADIVVLDQMPLAGAPLPPAFPSKGAAEAAAPASAPLPAPATLTGAETRRKGKESLGARALLRPAAFAEDDVGQQAQAQEACVLLARSLLVAPGAGAGLAAADAMLLDCAPNPLVASMLLRDAAAALATAAGTGSVGARHLAAQRSAALSLWRGDLGAALDVLISREALTSDFASLAAGFSPGGAPPAWRAIARLHAQGLEEGGEAHSAALHLLALGEAEAAARLLARTGLLREAVLLASARLLPAQALLLVSAL